MTAGAHTNQQPAPQRPAFTHGGWPFAQPKNNQWRHHAQTQAHSNQPHAWPYTSRKNEGKHNAPYCSRPLDYENKLTPNGAWVDHVIPYSKGGTHEQSNLIVCCRTCNISKGNRAKPKSKTIMASTPLRTSRRW
ncbi:HNH endonuclease [Glutamicibacter sp. JL.03c]|uniref:HNH endonuclease n=1 Tax=Glutamicibacter sp. JL.03c TaxID=2984842 RepID=UPI0039AFC496